MVNLNIICGVGIQIELILTLTQSNTVVGAARLYPIRESQMCIMFEMESVCT